MNKPSHQIFLLYISWMITGIVFVSSVFEVFSNLKIIPPYITYSGTLVIIVVSLAVNYKMRKYPLTWITNDGQQIRLKSLGIGSWFTLSGLVIALWIPRMVNITTPNLETAPTSSGTISINNSKQYYFIDISPIANFEFDHMVNPPQGKVSLGDIPFELPDKIRSKNTIFQSQRRLLSFLTTECVLDVEIPKPSKIYLLLNADYLYKNSEGNFQRGFEGNVVGTITLEFSNGAVHEIPLTAWENIRSIVVPDEDKEEFSQIKITDGNIQIRNVWTEQQIRSDGSKDYGYWAWMDMITIPLPEKYLFDTLVKITLKDTSVVSVNSQDPSLVLVGITVEGIK